MFASVGGSSFHDNMLESNLNESVDMWPSQVIVDEDIVIDESPASDDRQNITSLADNIAMEIEEALGETVTKDVDSMNWEEFMKEELERKVFEPGDSLIYCRESSSDFLMSEHKIKAEHEYFDSNSGIEDKDEMSTPLNFESLINQFNDWQYSIIKHKKLFTVPCALHSSKFTIILNFFPNKLETIFWLGTNNPESYIFDENFKTITKSNGFLDTYFSSTFSKNTTLVQINHLDKSKLTSQTSEIPLNCDALLEIIETKHKIEFNILPLILQTLCNQFMEELNGVNESKMEIIMPMQEIDFSLPKFHANPLALYRYNKLFLLFLILKENLLKIKKDVPSFENNVELEQIDGVRLFAFETETEMLEYTKLQTGLMNYIKPTKTNDITKIKGWRNKFFARTQQTFEESDSVNDYNFAIKDEIKDENDKIVVDTEDLLIKDQKVVDTLKNLYLEQIKEDKVIKGLVGNLIENKDNPIAPFQSSLLSEYLNEETPPAIKVDPPLPQSVIKCLLKPADRSKGEQDFIIRRRRRMNKIKKDTEPTEIEGVKHDLIINTKKAFLTSKTHQNNAFIWVGGRPIQMASSRYKSARSMYPFQNMTKYETEPTHDLRIPFTIKPGKPVECRFKKNPFQIEEQIEEQKEKKIEPPKPPRRSRRSLLEDIQDHDEIKIKILQKPEIFDPKVIEIHANYNLPFITTCRKTKKHHKCLNNKSQLGTIMYLGYGRPIRDEQLDNLKNLQTDGKIDNLTAHFATSAVVCRGKVTCQRLIVPVVTEKVVKNLKFDEMDKPVAVGQEIFDLMEGMLGYTERKMENFKIDYDPDFSVEPEKEEVKKKTYNKSSKVERELKKLIDVSLVDVTMKSNLQLCSKEYCALGCVCGSLNQKPYFVEHCGRLKCMFGCNCPKKYLLNNVYDQTVSKEELSRRQTVIRKGNNDIEVISGSGRKRQKKLPSRFRDLVLGKEMMTIDKSKNISPVKSEETQSEEDSSEEELKKDETLPKDWGKYYDKATKIITGRENMPEWDVDKPIRAQIMSRRFQFMSGELSGELTLADVFIWCAIHSKYNCLCVNYVCMLRKNFLLWRPDKINRYLAHKNMFDIHLDNVEIHLEAQVYDKEEHSARTYGSFFNYRTRNKHQLFRKKREKELEHNITQYSNSYVKVKLFMANEVQITDKKALPQELTTSVYNDMKYIKFHSKKKNFNRDYLNIQVTDKDYDSDIEEITDIEPEKIEPVTEKETKNINKIKSPIQFNYSSKAKSRQIEVTKVNKTRMKFKKSLTAMSISKSLEVDLVRKNDERVQRKRPRSPDVSIIEIDPPKKTPKPMKLKHLSSPIQGPLPPLPNEKQESQKSIMYLDEDLSEMPNHGLLCLTPGIGYLRVMDYTNSSKELVVQDPLVPLKYNVFRNIDDANVWLSKFFKNRVLFDMKSTDLKWIIATAGVLKLKKSKAFDSTILEDPTVTVTKTGIIRKTFRKVDLRVQDRKKLEEKSQELRKRQNVEYDCVKNVIKFEVDSKKIKLTDEEKNQILPDRRVESDLQISRCDPIVSNKKSLKDLQHAIAQPAINHGNVQVEKLRPPPGSELKQIPFYCEQTRKTGFRTVIVPKKPGAPSTPSTAITNFQPTYSSNIRVHQHPNFKKIIPQQSLYPSNRYLPILPKGPCPALNPRDGT